MSTRRIFDYQELTHRKALLDKILSTHNVILEFDKVTGGIKVWAWYHNFILIVRLKI